MRRYQDHKVRVVTAPAVEPVTVVEAKSHLRVDISDDDTLIEGYIQAAREWVEQYTGRALVTQTLRLQVDDFPPCAAIYLPRPPLQSVTHVKYYDQNGDLQTLPTTDYIVDAHSEPAIIAEPVDVSWPVTEYKRPSSVEVVYVAGYEDSAGSPSSGAENIPQAIKTAMLLLIGNMYENREAVVIGSSVATLSMGVESLLQPYRVLRF